MSFRACAWFCQHGMKKPLLTQSARSVLGVLCHRHNSKTGQCNPSQSTIGRDCGLLQPHVSRAVKQLVALNLIRVKKVVGKSFYQINFAYNWVPEVADDIRKIRANQRAQRAAEKAEEVDDYCDDAWVEDSPEKPEEIPTVVYQAEDPPEIPRHTNGGMCTHTNGGMSPIPMVVCPSEPGLNQEKEPVLGRRRDLSRKPKVCDAMRLAASRREKGFCETSRSGVRTPNGGFVNGLHGEHTEQGTPSSKTNPPTPSETLPDSPPEAPAEPTAGPTPETPAEATAEAPHESLKRSADGGAPARKRRRAATWSAEVIVRPDWWPKESAELWECVAGFAAWRTRAELIASERLTARGWDMILGRLKAWFLAGEWSDQQIRTAIEGAIAGSYRAFYRGDCLFGFAASQKETRRGCQKKREAKEKKPKQTPEEEASAQEAMRKLQKELKDPNWGKEQE